MLDLNLLETQDLVFALPLTPDGHGGARDSIAMVGEIDVGAGVAGENAEGLKDLSAWSVQTLLVP